MSGPRDFHEKAPHPVRSRRPPLAISAASACILLAGCAAEGPEELPEGEYPWHTGIVATTFWVGEIFDSTASDGSQVISAYDGEWMVHYGGCDGILLDGTCETEERDEDNGYFPRNMQPLENPFYLDLPFDDVTNEQGFAMRDEVVPWADEVGYAAHSGDLSYSFMKNRWVMLHREGRFCYGQIQDAGPGVYDDWRYVFGDDDRRPANTRYGGAGLDVSPALNGCLGFEDLNGMSDLVDWSFVDAADVPDGPWKRIVTTSQVNW